MSKLTKETTDELLNTALESLRNVTQDIINHKDDTIEDLENKIKDYQEDDKDTEKEIEDLEKEKDNIESELNLFKDCDIKETEKVVILQKKHFKSFDSLNIPLLEVLMYLPYEKLKDIVDRKAVSKEYKDY